MRLMVLLMLAVVLVAGCTMLETRTNLERAGQGMEAVAPFLPPPYNIVALSGGVIATALSGILAALQKKKSNAAQRAIVTFGKLVEHVQEQWPDEAKVFLSKLDNYKSRLDTAETQSQVIFDAVRKGVTL